MYYIYEIFNKVTGRKYIGQTINHNNRVKVHMANLRKGIHLERLMQRDYVLYGEDSFDYRLIDFAKNHSEAIQKEKHYMIISKTYEEEYGYNSQDAYFNKYQSMKEPVNKQNYFFQKAKEKNIPLIQIAKQMGVSRPTLIRNMVHPRTFSVNGFKKFIEVLGISKEEAISYMGWDRNKTTKHTDVPIEMFSKLSERNQQLVVDCIKAILGESNGH